MQPSFKRRTPPILAFFSRLFTEWPRTMDGAFYVAELGMSELIRDINAHLASGGQSLKYDLPCQFKPQSERLGSIDFVPLTEWVCSTPWHAYRDVSSCSRYGYIKWMPTNPKHLHHGKSMRTMGDGWDRDGWHSSYERKYNKDKFKHQNKGLWSTRLVCDSVRTIEINGKLYMFATEIASIDMTCVKHIEIPSENSFKRWEKAVKLFEALG